jgi:hypothetical protein
VSPRGSTANRDDASNLVAFSASYWAPMWLLNSSVSPVRHTIRGRQWSSVVISGHQWSSVVISGHQWSSAVISGNQCATRSAVISGHLMAIRSQSDGNPRQSPGRSSSLSHPRPQHRLPTKAKSRARSACRLGRASVVPGT